MGGIFGGYSDLDDEWRSKIYELTQQVVESVMPSVRKGDHINICRLVNMHIVPGGSLSDVRVIYGTIIQKNITLQKMRTEFTDRPPRILIIQGNIEVEINTSEFTVMERLVEQKEKAEELLIIKLLSLKPDVILVGKGITLASMYSSFDSIIQYMFLSLCLFHQPCIQSSKGCVLRG
jgi:chaperonin GroEL (HSP60 family)